MREHSLFFFCNIHHESVNFMLKSSICLVISKLLYTFAAEIITIVSPRQHGKVKEYEITKLYRRDNRQKKGVLRNYL